MEEILGDEPEVKERLFDVLKQYATERDVESLACILPEILITEEHQQLIESVRYTSISLSNPDYYQTTSPNHYKYTKRETERYFIHQGKLRMVRWKLSYFWWVCDLKVTC